MIDLLVISHPCVTAINRVIYRELAAIGWDLELVVPSSLSAEHGYFRKSDPPVPGDPPIHELERLGDNQRLHFYRGLLPLLEAKRPRLVLLETDPGCTVAIEVGLWARARGAHVFCQTAENMDRRFSDRLRLKQYARALRDVGIKGMIGASRPLVDHVFVLSDDGLRVEEAAGFQGRVTKIPLGFDGKLFKPDDAVRDATRRALGLNQVTVAYFGRVIAQKGVHQLVEVLSRMLDQPWQLLLDQFAEVKDPYARQVQEQLQATGVGARTVFFDAKHEEMPRYMNAADIVVMPSLSTESWREQYGRVAPESMACGRTVLVSSCGALPELVGDAGLVFPEGDSNALRAALARVLGDSDLRAELGARAARRAGGLLSMTAQRDQMSAQFSRFAQPSRVAAAA